MFPRFMGRVFATLLLSLAILTAGVGGVFASTAPMNCGSAMGTMGTDTAMDGMGSAPTTAQQDAAVPDQDGHCWIGCLDCLICLGGSTCVALGSWLQPESFQPLPGRAGKGNWSQTPDRAGGSLLPAVPPPITV